MEGKVAALLQGIIVTVQGQEYTVRNSLEEEHTVCSTSMTVNNGWPKIGERVLIMVNDQQQALVMTRYWCSHSHAA